MDRHEFYLPRELWVAILEWFTPRVVLRWTTVNRYWRELVNESVKVLQGVELKRVDDEILRRFGSLESLEIGSGWGESNAVTDAGITALTMLNSLTLRGASLVTSTGLAQLPNLRTLAIDGNRCIADSAFDGLAQLTDLCLQDCAVTDSGIEKLTNLARLTLRHMTGVTDAGFSGLSHLTSLEVFCCDYVLSDGWPLLTNLQLLNFTSNSGASSDFFCRLINITELDLGAIIHAKDMNGISVLSNLNSLTLSCLVNVNDDAIKQLIGLTKLALPENRSITDNGLSSLVNLTFLDVQFAEKITSDGIRELTNLTFLRLSSNHNLKGFDEALLCLTKLTTLHLDCSDSVSITNAGISMLASLTDLELTLCENLGDEAVETLTNLTRLNIASSCSIGDDGIKKLTKLRSLVTCGNPVSDTGLFGLTNLTYLSLDNPAEVTDNGMTRLNSLASLTLRNAMMITNDGISKMSNLGCLLLIGKTNITLDMTNDYYKAITTRILFDWAATKELDSDGLDGDSF